MFSFELEDVKRSQGINRPPFYVDLIEQRIHVLSEIDPNDKPYHLVLASNQELDALEIVENTKGILVPFNWSMNYKHFEEALTPKRILTPKEKSALKNEINAYVLKLRGDKTAGFILFENGAHKGSFAWQIVYHEHESLNEFKTIKTPYSESVLQNGTWKQLVVIEPIITK